RVELALQATADCPVEHRQHVTAVRRIELARHARALQSHVLDVRAAAQQFAVADDNDASLDRRACQLDAELGADARRLAGGQRDNGRPRAHAAYRSSSRTSI